MLLSFCMNFSTLFWDPHQVLRFLIHILKCCETFFWGHINTFFQLWSLTRTKRFKKTKNLLSNMNKNNYTVYSNSGLGRVRCYHLFTPMYSIVYMKAETESLFYMFSFSVFKEKATDVSQVSWKWKFSSLNFNCVLIFLGVEDRPVFVDCTMYINIIVRYTYCGASRVWNLVIVCGEIRQHFWR